MSELINEEPLKEWTGHKQRPALMKWLREQRIPYLVGNGGRVCVTEEAINHRLLGADPAMKPDAIEFEF